MDLTDNLVTFHLSSEGRQALRGLVPTAPSFEAFVVDMDNVGPWVLLGPRTAASEQPAAPVMLLKWDYISAVALQLRLAEEV